ESSSVGPLRWAGVSSDIFPGGTAFLIPFVVVALAVFSVVAVVTARRDPDPAGDRPYAVYLSLVLFVATFTAMFAATAVASNAIRIPLKDTETTAISVFGSSSGSASGIVTPGGASITRIAPQGSRRILTPTDVA